jgi:hypothetical protein
VYFQGVEAANPYHEVRHRAAGRGLAPLSTQLAAGPRLQAPLFALLRRSLPVPRPSPGPQAVPELVQAAMDRVAKVTGRQYHLFDYVGHPEAERVVIAMGSGSEVLESAVEHLNKLGEKVGLVKVRRSCRGGGQGWIVGRGPVGMGPVGRGGCPSRPHQRGLTLCALPLPSPCPAPRCASSAPGRPSTCWRRCRPR